MKSFDGFKRRAVVIIPADDEYQRRVAKREAEEGKDVPDTAVLEMKGGFFLFCVAGGLCFSVHLCSLLIFFRTLYNHSLLLPFTSLNFVSEGWKINEYWLS